MKKDIFHFHHQNIGVDLPYYEFEGSGKGPHIVISGGMHGNEINGISIVRKLLSGLISSNIEDTLVGKITVIPLLNPTGFHGFDRYVTIDGKDPNRCFGIEKDKTYTHFRCDALIEKFYKTADFGIDVHDAGGRGALIPHPRIHLCENGNCIKCTHEMAKLLDTEIILERKGTDHMLATYLQRELSVPLITIEAGGGQIMYPKFHEQILRGIDNILIHYGFKEGDVVLKNKQLFLEKRKFYKARESGEIEFSIELGDHIKKGERLAHIYYNASQTEEEIFAKEDGVVFSITNSNQIRAGGNIMSQLVYK